MNAENPMGAVNIHVLIKTDHFVALVKLVMLLLVMKNLVKLHILAFPMYKSLREGIWSRFESS